METGAKKAGDATDWKVTRTYIWPHRTLWMLLGLAGGLVLMQSPGWIFLILPALVWLWLASGRQLFRECVVLGMLFFLVGCGLSLYQQQEEARYRSLPEGRIQIQGIVADHRDGSGYLHLRCGREKLQVLLTDEMELHWYPAGTKLKLEGTISQPHSRRNPGGFDEQEWLRGNGIYRIIRAEQISVEEEPKGAYRMAMLIRLRCNAVLQAFFPEQEQALIQGMLFGEKYRLEDSFYRLTQRLGIAHIFAVSGLHVGFLAGLLMLGLQLIRQNRSGVGTATVGLFLFGYILLTGFSPSVLRASGMLMLALWGRKILCPVVPLDHLALCGVVLLLYRPNLLWTAGFQLSFGVTASLLVFAGPMQQMLKQKKIPSKPAAAFAVVLASWLGSTPLMAGWFCSISLISPLANLLLVPLFSVTVPLVAVTLCIGMTGIPGGEIVAVPARILLQAVIVLPELTEGWLNRWHIPLQWNTGAMPKGWFFIWIIGLMLLWLQLRMALQNPDHTPEQTRPVVRTNHCRILSAVCLAGLLILCIPQNPARDSITWLYAGQGSSAVLRTTEGEVFVFDCGSSATELLSVLRWMGVNHIDGIILSHGDSDHIAGLFPVTEAILTDRIYGVAGELERVAKARKESGCISGGQQLPFCIVSEPCILSLQHGRILFWPTESAIADVRNGQELAAAFAADQQTVAFPGDLEAESATKFATWLPDISIWTVPHHGSRGSCSPELYKLLQRKGTRVAVISAGENNRYGHPHAETLHRIQEARIRCLRTDAEGAITIVI